MRIPMLLVLTSVLALIASACGTSSSGGHQMPDGSTMGGNMPTMTTGSSPEAGSDPDLTFIDAMRVHHQSAVEMARIALEKSQREEIRTMASGIIEAQQAEIEQLGQWRDAWYPNAPESDMTGMTGMAGMAMGDDQLQMLRDAEDVDKMFIDMMIPHHESAISMARSLQDTTERPELQELTDAIITAQEGEIAQMKQWRAEWYGE